MERDYLEDHERDDRATVRNFKIDIKEIDCKDEK